MSAVEKVGWGSDAIHFSPNEVIFLNELMELNGGSVYETLKTFLGGKDAPQKEVLRIVNIIENRESMMKTVESIVRGAYCESYGRAIF